MPPVHDLELEMLVGVLFKVGNDQLRERLFR
jgi:hypothetical protein